MDRPPLSPGSFFFQRRDWAGGNRGGRREAQAQMEIHQMEMVMAMEPMMIRLASLASSPVRQGRPKSGLC